MLGRFMKQLYSHSSVNIILVLNNYNKGCSIYEIKQSHQTHFKRINSLSHSNKKITK